jgi:hypothetical protein
MAAPSMSGAELGGRLIGLEALVLALATELLVKEDETKAQAIFTAMKGIAQALIDNLTPDAGQVHPIIKQLEEHASAYVDQHIETISRQRAKLLRALAAKPEQAAG